MPRFVDCRSHHHQQAAEAYEGGVSTSEAITGPPPIRHIRPATNPEDWTATDTMKFLAQTTDCGHLAHFMVEDQIDGPAFMLLNYPTVQSYWKLKTSTAIKLCQHVESVRLAHLTQFP